MQNTGLALGLLLALGGGVKLSSQIGLVYPTATPALAPVTVTGVVIDASTGTPVPRALVQISSRAVLTDHDGKFNIAQFSEAGGMVQVTKPGYYSSPDGNNGGTYISANRLSEPMRLRLYPEALLTGTVTAADDGSPLEQVQVNALRSVFDENGHRWIPAGQAQTNVRGEFRIPVPEGEYRLQTAYQAHSTTNHSVIFSVATRNPSGNTLGLIGPRPGEHQRLDLHPADLQTAYQTHSMERHDVILPVIFPGNSSDNTLGSIRLRPGEQQRFDLHPAEQRAYVVSIVLEPAVEFAMIHARIANGPGFQVATVRAPKDGLYKIELPSGSYTLTATKYSPDGPEFAEANVTVADHDLSGVVLRFSPTQTLPVEVRVDSAMSDNAEPPNPNSLGLTLRNMNPADPNFSDVPSRRQEGSLLSFHASPGRYRLRTHNFGSWFVESATYGGLDLLRQELVVAPGGGGEPIELTVGDRIGSLTGVATVKGVPENCWIYLIPSTPSATSVISTVSNAARGYLWNLPPGTYQAIAFETRHSADWSDPATLVPFSSHVRTVTIHAGDKATLDLDAVTDEEIAP